MTLSLPAPTPSISVEAEQAVLGAALQDAPAAHLVATRLTAGDFQHPVARSVFVAIASCVQRQQAVDRLTVYQALIEQGQEDGLSPTVLLDMEEAVPSAANVEQYVRLVEQASRRRRIRTAVVRAAEQIDDPTVDLTRTAADLSEDLSVITGGDPEADRVLAAEPVRDILTRWMAQVDAGPQPTVPTPFPTLNYYLDGGFGQGDLVYLGARPGVGKTAMALAFARHAAQAGIGTMIVSREMVSTSLLRRMLSQATRIPSSAIKRASLDQAQWHILSKEYGRIRELPLWVTDAAVAIGEIRALVDGWSAGTPLGLVVVDYLQLVRAPNGIKERRFQVEAVSSELKALAMASKTSVVCLSSLARPAGGDPNARPTMGSLKESGNLEHDADTILLLHRPEDAVEAECILAKNRDGRVGMVRLTYTAEILTFAEVG